MLILKKLEINNFQSIERLLMHFDGAMTVIVGENGSGKTSFLEAMIWALYGKVRDKVANIKSNFSKKKKDTRVSVSFDYKGHQYDIIRSLGTPKIKVIKDGEDMTNRDSNHFFDSLIPYNAFLLLTVSRRAFFSLSDTEKRRLLLNIAGGFDFQNILKKVKKHREELDRELLKVEMQIENCSNILAEDIPDNIDIDIKAITSEITNLTKYKEDCLQKIAKQEQILQLLNQVLVGKCPVCGSDPKPDDVALVNQHKPKAQAQITKLKDLLNDIVNALGNLKTQLIKAEDSNRILEAKKTATKCLDQYKSVLSELEVTRHIYVRLESILSKEIEQFIVFKLVSFLNTHIKKYDINIDILIENDKITATYQGRVYDVLSCGEKRLCDIYFSLLLKDISPNKNNIIWFDEYLDSLDNNNFLSVIRTIQERNQDYKIIVTTHREQFKFDNCLSVTKVDGKTQISKE